MRRREFITLLGGAAGSWPLAARAQQPPMPVIGFLHSASPDGNTARVRAFREGLKEAGFVEGENVAVEYRWAEYQFDGCRHWLMNLFVEGLLSSSRPGAPQVALAAKAATRTTPVVFLVGEDPVRLGLVTSLAQPGANLTGINFFGAEIAAKRLELLHEFVPRAVRIGVLVNPTNTMTTESTLRDVKVASHARGLQIQVLNASTSREIDAVFESFVRARPDALFVSVASNFNDRRVQLVLQAILHRVPAIFPVRDFVEVGGLVSYGASLSDALRQVGVYTGRILKGAKPGDLPVVQSTKFELAINHQTARMLGLTVPDKLLVAADEVIE